MAEIKGRCEVERLVAGGEGLARLDGRVVFVPGAFPGDVVDLTAKAKKRWGRATSWTLAEASPHRVKPPCAWADRCGGCDWMGLELAEQRRAKGAVVLEALRRTGRLEGVPDTIEVIAAGDDVGWRRRVRLHVDRKGRVGFFARRTREVVPIDACLVADPRLNALLPDLAGSEPGTITAQVEDGEVRVHRGEAPFVQANAAVNERLVADVTAQATGRGSRFLELYAGAGNFSVPLARAGLSGVTVEGHPAAADRARAAAEGLPLEVRTGDAADIEGVGDVDLVLLDPPRAGAADAIGPVADLQPQWIAYVSCDPVTLARDLGALQERGYRLTDVVAYDMFPHTHHVETVAWMRRSAPPATS